MPHSTVAAEATSRPQGPSIGANINPWAPRRTINSSTETECINNFRFTKTELHQLFCAVKVPAYITATHDGKAGHKFEGRPRCSAVPSPALASCNVIPRASLDAMHSTE